VVEVVSLPWYSVKCLIRYGLNVMLCNVCVLSSVAAIRGRLIWVFFFDLTSPNCTVLNNCVNNLHAMNIMRCSRVD